MKLPIGYRRVARTEYDEAAVWYESEQKGLGDDLVAVAHEIAQWDDLLVGAEGLLQ